MGGAHGCPGTCPSWSFLGPTFPGAQAAPYSLPMPHHQAPNKALASILGKSNLRFAGMSIAVSISIDGLNLSVPATRQVSAATSLSLRRPHSRQAGWAHGGEAWRGGGCRPVFHVQVLVRTYRPGGPALDAAATLTAPQVSQ